MPRIVLILTLVLAAGQAGGLLWFGDDACTEDCTDGKQCPPRCPTCACAGTIVPSIPTPTATLVPPPSIEHVIEFATPRVLAPSPDPREITHVPRAQVV